VFDASHVSLRFFWPKCSFRRQWPTSPKFSICAPAPIKAPMVVGNVTTPGTWCGGGSSALRPTPTATCSTCWCNSPIDSLRSNTWVSMTYPIVEHEDRICCHSNDCLCTPQFGIHRIHARFEIRWQRLYHLIPLLHTTLQVIASLMWPLQHESLMYSIQIELPKGGVPCIFFWKSRVWFSACRYYFTISDRGFYEQKQDQQ
jgi:hypothetical protein